eukprot:SAG11_NODE_3224_length_2600_cov_3.746901_6_plen_57_part_00
MHGGGEKQTMVASCGLAPTRCPGLIASLLSPRSAATLQLVSRDGQTATYSVGNRSR